MCNAGAYIEGGVMIDGFAVLVTCQLAGEAIVSFTNLPVPGPVIGMLILFISLVIRGSVPIGLSAVAHGLLQHLLLLFVPAGVGVILYMRQITAQWIPIVAVLVVGTQITIAVTGIVTQILVPKSVEK